MTHHIFKSLAHPTRLAIVSHLINVGERDVGSINKLVPISQPSLSQHLAILRKAGVVKSRREARQVIYAVAKPKKMAKLIQIGGEL